MCTIPSLLKVVADAAAVLWFTIAKSWQPGAITFITFSNHGQQCNQGGESLRGCPHGTACTLLARLPDATIL